VILDDDTYCIIYNIYDYVDVDEDEDEVEEKEIEDSII